MIVAIWFGSHIKDTLIDERYLKYIFNNNVQKDRIACQLHSGAFTKFVRFDKAPSWTVSQKSTAPFFVFLCGTNLVFVLLGFSLPAKLDRYVNTQKSNVPWVYAVCVGWSNEKLKDSWQSSLRKLHVYHSIFWWLFYSFNFFSFLVFGHLYCCVCILFLRKWCHCLRHYNKGSFAIFLSFQTVHIFQGVNLSNCSSIQNLFWQTKKTTKAWLNSSLTNTVLLLL